MDRSEIQAKDTSDLRIMLPDGRETDFVITVQDMQEREPKAVIKKWDKMESRSRKGVSFEKKEELGIELLMACIVDWTGYTDNGKPIECTEETKRELLTDKNLFFVRRQIDEHIGDIENFLSVNGKG